MACWPAELMTRAGYSAGFSALDCHRPRREAALVIRDDFLKALIRLTMPCPSICERLRLRTTFGTDVVTDLVAGAF
jgi:hypothetical protein